MLKTQNKIFSILLIFTLLSFISVKVEAATKITRLSGLNRYATSAAVALDGWQQSDYVILTSGANFPDALSAAPLAKKYNAPIMLTQKDGIPTETINAIKGLKAKNILIIGGTGVISTTVENKIKLMGIRTTRFAGADRYETAIKVAEQLDNVSEIFIVTGEDFPDALSISPIAVKRNMPIILIGHNVIPRVVKSYINSHNITKTYVVGAGSSLDESTLSTLTNVEEISGGDKYQRNLAVIDRFKSDLDFNTVYMTSGENFPDGLTGSILAGKNSNAMFLVGNDCSSEKNYFSENSIALNNLKILGGTGVVTEDTINNLIDTTTNTDLSVTDIAKNVNAIVKLEAKDKNNNVFATGSGCIITSDGKVVTNYNVINGAYFVDVVLEDGTKYEVDEILGYSKEKDLAILTLKNASNLPKVGLGDSDTLQLGDSIVTIGSPAGIQNTVATGIVSGLNRNNSRVGKDIQISATIDKGSSGGGLFNMSGQVVGITYLEAVASSGYNYAIPINEVKPLINISTTTTTTLAQLAASTTPVTTSYFPLLSDVPVPVNANYYKVSVAEDAEYITYYYSMSSVLNNFVMSFSKSLVDSGFKLSETNIVNGKQVTIYTKGDNSVSIGFVGYDIYITGNIH